MRRIVWTGPALVTVVLLTACGGDSESSSGSSGGSAGERGVCAGMPDSCVEICVGDECECSCEGSTGGGGSGASGASGTAGLSTGGTGGTTGGSGGVTGGIGGAFPPVGATGGVTGGTGGATGGSGGVTGGTGGTTGGSGGLTGGTGGTTGGSGGLTGGIGGAFPPVGATGGVTGGTGGDAGSGGDAGVGGDAGSAGDAGSGGANGGSGGDSACAEDCEAQGFFCCDGQCVNLANDIYNCGACGVVCQGDFPYCGMNGCEEAPCTGVDDCPDRCCGSQCCGEGELCCEVNMGPAAMGCFEAVNGTCPVGCPYCVCASPDTPVATPDGERPIAELRVGDLVYSNTDRGVVVVPIVQVNRVAVSHHHVMRVTLATGRVLEVSAAHPTSDGHAFGELQPGSNLDGVAVVSVEFVPYAHTHTYDILPASSTGAYYAAGVAVGSTLSPDYTPPGPQRDGGAHPVPQVCGAP